MTNASTDAQVPDDQQGGLGQENFNPDGALPRFN